MILVSYPRNHCQIQHHEGFLLYFLLRVFIILLLYVGRYLFWVHVCIWCKVRVHLHSFECRYPVSLAQFTKGPSIPPLHCLGSLGGSQLTTRARAHLWVLCAFPGLYTDLCQHHAAQVTGALCWVLKSGTVCPPTSFFFFKITLATRGSPDILYKF